MTNDGADGGRRCGGGPTGGRRALSRTQPRRRPVERQQRPVGLGAAVAEHAPLRPLLPHRLEIERGGDEGVARRVRLGDDGPVGAGDERPPPEVARAELPALAPDAVGADERGQVRPGVPLHDAVPVVLAVAGDAARVEQELGALQAHDARGLGEPLVPADGDADPPDRGVPDPEARVAGVGVDLLEAAGRALGDVGLPVDAEDAAVGVDDRAGVVVGVVRALEEVDRDDDTELLRERGHPRHGRPVERLGEGEVLALPVHEREEVGREHLLRQHDLRAGRGRLAHDAGGLLEVLLAVPAAAHLGRGDGDGGHGEGFSSGASVGARGREGKGSEAVRAFDTLRRLGVRRPRRRSPRASGRCARSPRA